MFKIAASCIRRVYALEKMSILSQSNYGYSKGRILCFPYLFGGIEKQVDPQGRIAQKQTQVKSVFGNGLDEGFSYAYRYLLESFNKHEIENLTDVLELKLKQTQYPLLSLQGQQAQIKIDYGKMSLCLGLPFDRRLHPKEMTKIFTNSSGLALYQGEGTFDQNGKVIFSIIVEVQFNSSMKLKPNDPWAVETDREKDLNRQERHVIQFELENRLSIWDTCLRIGMIYMKNMLFKSTSSEIFSKPIIGRGIWKISDIDYLLKGNLPKCK